MRPHLNPGFPEFVGAFHIVSCVLRFSGSTFCRLSGCIWKPAVYIACQMVFEDTVGVFGAKCKANPTNMRIIDFLRVSDGKHALQLLFVVS